MGEKTRKAKLAATHAGAAAVEGPSELPERWSAQRKDRAGVAAPAGGGAGCRLSREERDLTLARAKIGELMMRLELAELLIEKS